MMSMRQVVSHSRRGEGLLVAEVALDLGRPEAEAVRQAQRDEMAPPDQVEHVVSAPAQDAGDLAGGEQPLCPRRRRLGDSPSTQEPHQDHCLEALELTQVGGKLLGRGGIKGSLEGSDGGQRSPPIGLRRGCPYRQARDSIGRLADVQLSRCLIG
jgi:hypothetical protein